MSFLRRAYGHAATRSRPVPWLAFLILSAMFYLTYHPVPTPATIAASPVPGEGYNRPEDDIVAGVSAGSPVRQATLILLSAVAACSLAAPSGNRRFQYEGALRPALLAFLAWAFLSCLWADDLSQTSRRLVPFGMLCIIAVAIVRRFSLRQIILWTFLCTAFYLAVSIAAEAARGTLLSLSYGYRFAGTLHPNGEGIECGILVLAGIAAAQMQEQRRWIFWTGALLGFGFLVLTGSRTSLIATALAALVYVIAVSAKRPRLFILSGLSAVTAILLLLAGVGALSGVQKVLLLGRDDVGGQDITSFTGRTSIWEDVGPYVQQSPILGHGYAGFWTPEHISTISDEEKWGIPDSHSAYMDYVLTLGVVGVTLYACCLLIALWRAIVMCRIAREPALAFLVGFLVFCIVDGFLESAIGEGSLLTLLCVIALVWIASVPLQEIWELAVDDQAQRNEVCLA